MRRRSQGLAGSGLVRPRTGQTWWCLLPTVSLAAFALALATCARDEGMAAAHRAVLVVDRAGWHPSPTVTRPAGIDLVFLPPSSPEWPPAERLWPLGDAPVANRSFASLDELAAVLAPRCRALPTQRRPRTTS